MTEPPSSEGGLQVNVTCELDALDATDPGAGGAVGSGMDSHT